MIPKSPRSSRIFRLKINFLTCVGKTVNGKSPEVSMIFSKDFLIENILILILWALLTAVEKFTVNCARVMADEDPS